MPLPYPLTSMGLKTTQLHLNSRGSIVFCFFPLDPWGGGWGKSSTLSHNLPSHEGRPKFGAAAAHRLDEDRVLP